MKNKISYLFLSLVLLISPFAFASVAFAQTTPPGNSGWAHMQRRGPGIYGTVSAINGNSLTVTSNGFGENPSATTYTVDATNATITKAGSASSLTNIALGDTVMVVGMVSGTNVTATVIHDGALGGMRGRGAPGVIGVVASNNGTTLTIDHKNPKDNSTTTYTISVTGTSTFTKNGVSTTIGNMNVGDTVLVFGTVSGTNVTATSIRDGVPSPNANGMMSSIKGNGEPVIGGSVTAVNGSTLTVTNSSNVTYTVDAANATITKSNATTTVSGITIGDNVVIQGTVNGNSVTASSVIDNGANASTGSIHDGLGFGHMGGLGGFFGGIGNFFKHLFGF